jgi:hypothetical protein
MDNGTLLIQQSANYNVPLWMVSYFLPKIEIGSVASAGLFSFWHKAADPGCPQFGRYRGQNGHGPKSRFGSD